MVTPKPGEQIFHLLRGITMKNQRTLNVSDNVVNTLAQLVGDEQRQREQLLELIDAQLGQIGGGEETGCF